MLKREEIRQGLDLLREKFPGAFPKDKFVVLKKGIDLDICKSNSFNLSRTKLRTLLTVYTGYPGYIQAHVEGANRYDLEGNVVGQITKEEYVSYQQFQEKRLKQIAFLKGARQKHKEAEDVNKDTTTTIETNEQLRAVPEPQVLIRRKRIRPLHNRQEE